MDPSRTPGQVLSAAAAMDRARAAGLPDDVLLTLLAARAAWWGEGPWPDPMELHQILREPAAQQVDQVLWQAIRQHVRAPRVR